MRETANLEHLHRDELGKVCFAHDTAYSDRKDLAKRNISDHIFKDKLIKLLEIVDMIPKCINKYGLQIFLIRKQDQER